MPSEKLVYEPNALLARKAYISSFEQYQDLYKQSIENPENFWNNIAKQFHWETPVERDNFLSYNFDISKGKIFVKWMEGASTNITYNLLDKNVKNGHGDRIAFYW